MPCCKLPHHADLAIKYAGRKAEKEGRPDAILFKNARVFDGVTDELSPPQCVLIEGNKISKIGADLTAPAGVKCTECDVEGRTLMPGLIDMHSHVCFQEGMLEGYTYDQMAMGAMAGADLVDYLMQVSPSLPVPSARSCSSSSPFLSPPHSTSIPFRIASVSPYSGFSGLSGLGSGTT